MTRNELKNLYEDKGLTIRQIAEKYNVSYTKIRNLLKIYNIKLRDKHGQYKGE